MRLASLFLIVYVLFLSVQPCEDVIAQFDGHGHRIAATSHFEERSTHEDSDECSPFCICSCCGMPVASRQTAYVVLGFEPANAGRTTASIYKDPYQRNFLSSIWQPPKA